MVQLYPVVQFHPEILVVQLLQYYHILYLSLMHQMLLLQLLDLYLLILRQLQKHPVLLVHLDHLDHQFVPFDL